MFLGPSLWKFPGLLLHNQVVGAVADLGGREGAYPLPFCPLKESYKN